MPHIDKQMLSFFLTTKCNLRCVYCYNAKERKSREEITLPLEIAKAGIDYFFLNYPNRHIRFYGPGEPTQKFQLMKQITNYAKTRADGSLLVEIQTNGVFDKHVRSWVADNINIIWISFDGEPNIHDSNRPLEGGKPSSPIIEDNVNWLVEKSKSKNLMVGARVTMTNKNINRQIELIDYFFKIGIRHIWTDPLFPSVSKKPACENNSKIEKSLFDMDVYVENYIEAHKYAESLNVFYGSFLTCNFDGITNKHCRACTPVPHLTPDGYVSACDLVTFGEEANHMDCFVYGKWDDASNSFLFDNDKIKNLQNRSIENMPHCLNCNAQDYCGGYCLGEVTNETGDMLGQKPVVCEAVNKLLKEIGVPDSKYPYCHP